MPPALSPSPSMVFLTQALIESIGSQHAKLRQSDSYKVHRVLKNKLDDLAMDLRTHTPEVGGTAATTLSVTLDLAALARCAVSSKDAPQTLRYFWTGRPGYAEKKRREKEPVWSDGERERDDVDRGRDRDNKDAEKGGTAKDDKERDERSKERDKDTKSGDEGDKPWSGVQRKMENL